MFKTTEIYREMLELGMIDQVEYADLICEYRNHVNALMTMDLIAKKAKEEFESIKKHEESKQKETDTKYKRLCEAYLNGYISEEDFKRMTFKQSANSY